MQKGKQESYAEFLAQSGMKKDTIEQVLKAQGGGGGGGDSQPSAAGEQTSFVQDDLLPSHLDEQIDYDECLTDIQIKDGLNRLKLLGLKVLTYTHVVSGSTMAPVFLRDLSQQEPVHFHLTPDLGGGGEEQ